MTYDNYIKCSEGSSLPTGEFGVFYDFSSGSDDPNIGSFVFNLKYPTGDHWSNVTTQHGSNPEAVHADLLPGFVIGDTNDPISKQGEFGGRDLVQVGLHVNYSGWSAILDITPNLCDYSTQNNLSRVLFSTMDAQTSPSGFFVGINQSNKPYIQYNQGTNHPSTTLNRELGKDSVIAISQGENSVALAVYDLETEEAVIANIDTEGHPYSDTLYLGRFKSLPNSTIDYTGYEGNINYFTLFGSPLSNEELVSSCGCMFSTGVNVTTEVIDFSAPTITGFEDTTVYITGITGYETNYKEVPDPVGSINSNITIAYQSGVIGLIESGITTSFLTGEAVTSSTTGYLTGINYDQAKLNLYNQYFLNFKNGLKSGEHMEIATFSNPRQDVQLSLDEEDKVISSGIRLYNYGLYRQSKNDPSYMTQGERGESGARIASEDDGHDYDYAVLEDATLSGFIDYSDNIVYDLIDRDAICIDFSGYWGNASISSLTQAGLSPNKVYTGLGINESSETYFPSSPQFFNETDPALDQGQVIITGISGQKIWENNHIYYNGQKLIENVDFFTGHIETGNSLSTDALVITGGLPGVSVYGNSWDSIIDVPDSHYTPQMCFVPMVSGKKPSVLQKYIGGCTVPPYCSDSQYMTEATCLETDGTCSNNSFTDKTTCLQNGYDWTPTNTWTNTYESKAICEAKGGAWAPFNGIADPLSGFSEMIWLNGVRLQGGTDYRKGKECSMTKSFTFFGENPFIFYNNDSDFLNFG